MMRDSDPRFCPFRRPQELAVALLPVRNPLVYPPVRACGGTDSLSTLARYLLCNEGIQRPESSTDQTQPLFGYESEPLKLCWKYARKTVGSDVNLLRSA